MERDLDSSGTFEDSERFFHHADGLGSNTGLTDPAGAVRQAYVYDSFGQIIAAVCDTNTFVGVEAARGALGDSSVCLPNPYAYTGREFDRESGLYYYRARYFHPENGRFLQEDPVGGAGGINLYEYVGNNPVNVIDPFGLQVIPIRVPPPVPIPVLPPGPGGGDVSCGAAPESPGKCKCVGHCVNVRTGARVDIGPVPCRGGQCDHLVPGPEWRCVIIRIDLE